MRRWILLTSLLAGIVVAPGVSSAAGSGGWDHVGTGATPTSSSLDGWVYALDAGSPGGLLVGGASTQAGGNPAAARLARWTGAAWMPVASPPLDNGAVFAIASHDSRVFAGGTFTNAGGNANADFLAVWDGTTWAPFCASSTGGPTFTGNVSALQVLGNTLYVGGSFQNAAGIAAGDGLVACDLTTGATSAVVAKNYDLVGSVYALAADASGTLYAGGTFIDLAGIPEADHVAAYAGGSWHAMGAGPAPKFGAVDNMVRSLTAQGTDLYVGTDATDVAGIPTADHVVKWDGSAWSALGSNGSGDGWFSATTTINALATSGTAIFAAGLFQDAGGSAEADGVAYFDGTSWHPVGSDGAGNGPFIGELKALSVFGGRLYAGGNFTRAGGDRRAQSLAAYPLTRPDLMVSTALGQPAKGKGVYNNTGAGQTATQPLTRGHTVNFYVIIANSGIAPGPFVLKSKGTARGLSVKYFMGGNLDITKAIRGGGFTTSSVRTDLPTTLRVAVTAATSSAGAGSFPVSATAPGGGAVDVVRVAVKVKP
jgi:hypothetical protein